MEQNEVMDATEVIPTSVGQVNQLWARAQDVVAVRGLMVITAI